MVKSFKTITMIAIIAMTSLPSLVQSMEAYRPLGQASDTDPPLPAKTVNVEGLFVSLGDTPDKVETAYHTEQKPEPTAVTATTKGTFLHLQKEGLWFFFGSDGKITKIRMEAPFTGTINGIHIGDDPELVSKAFGKPHIVESNGTLTANIYLLDDVTTVGFVTHFAERVEALLLAKCIRDPSRSDMPICYE